MMRNTIQRELVLRAVRHLANHPTPQEVYHHVQKEYPSISKSTVYRNLNQLCEDNMLLHIPVPNGADHVDHNVTPHPHARCRICGAVFDLPASFFPPPLTSRVFLDNGFCVETYFVVYTGVCARCQTSHDRVSE